MSPLRYFFTHCRLLLFLALCGGVATHAHAQFDADGVQYLSPFGEPNNALGAALAVHADGGYTVAGTAFIRGQAAPVSLLLRRFNPDGTPDPGFSFSLEHGVSIHLSPRSLLALPDGGLLLAYTVANPNSPSDSFSRLIKLDAKGDAAAGFTPFTFDPSLGADIAHALALQADGRILMAGSRPAPSGGGERWAIAVRLHASGSPSALSVRLRHAAAPVLGVETVTQLELGGVVRSHNHALTVGSTAELRMESLTGRGAAIFAEGFEGGE